MIGIATFSMRLSDLGTQMDDNRHHEVKLSERGTLIHNKLDVLLISSRSGGIGCNIQRIVIIFDFTFNPTWEEQAIGTAYRLGRTKCAFVSSLS